MIDARRRYSDVAAAGLDRWVCQAADEWRTHGAAIVRGACDPDETREARRQILAMFAERSRFPHYEPGEPFWHLEQEGAARGAEVLVFHKHALRRLPRSPLWALFFTLRKAVIDAIDPQHTAESEVEAFDLHATFILMREGHANEAHDDVKYVGSRAVTVLHLSQPGVDYRGGEMVLDPELVGVPASRLDHSIGDVVFFPPERCHAVNAVTWGTRLVMSVARPRFDESVFHVFSGDVTP